MNKFPELKKTDEFPLWSFYTSRGMSVTRGRTIEEATHYIKDSVWPLLCNPIGADKIYSRSHKAGWITQPMYWLCEHLGLNPKDYGHESQMDTIKRMARELGLV